MTSKLTGALAALALAAGGGYALAQSTANPGSPATPGQQQQQLNPESSHPGVQGMPGNKSGPATRSPGDGSSSGASSGASSGTSSGTGGSSTTQPAQDPSKVQGMPDNKSGPSTRQPGEER